MASEERWLAARGMTWWSGGCARVERSGTAEKGISTTAEVEGSGGGCRSASTVLDEVQERQLCGLGRHPSGGGRTSLTESAGHCFPGVTVSFEHSNTGEDHEASVADGGTDAVLRARNVRAGI